MSDARNKPDRTTLERFLLGRLDDSQQRQVEQ